MRHVAIVILLALVVLGVTAAIGVARAEAMHCLPRTDYATGAGPRGVAVADLNGDGALDMITADWYGATMTVLLGDGAGGFGAPHSYPTGSNSVAVTVGDFNGDAHPDAAVANWGADTVSVLLGDGTGAFGPTTDYAAGSVPNGVVCGDLDDDGELDLAVADYLGNTVSILLGVGDGTFQTGTAYATGGYAVSIGIGDLDGDDELDLVTTNDGGPGSASVLLGDGTGAFTTCATYGIGSVPRGSFVIDDLNGDDHPDIATACADDNGVAVLLNDGAGDFGAASTYLTGAHPTGVAGADFDKDGSVDLATADYYGDSVTIVFNEGDGAFWDALRYPAGSSAREVATGDFNDDTYPDLAVTALNASIVSVYLQGYTIGVGHSTHGEVTPGAGDVGPDSTPTYAFSPDPGYYVAQVLVDGSPVTMTGENEYTFPAVAADHELYVAFSASADNVPTATVSGWRAGWQKRPVTLAFTGHPGPYGVAIDWTEYRLGDEVTRAGDGYIVGSSVRIRAEGVTRVHYRAVDVEGVRGPAKVCTVKLDTHRPTLDARDAAGPARATASLRYRVRDALPGSGLALVRAVVFDASGRVATRASTLPVPVNAWRTLHVSTRALLPGTYLVVLRTMDAAGNFQRDVTRVTLTVR